MRRGYIQSEDAQLDQRGQARGLGSGLARLLVFGVLLPCLVGCAQRLETLDVNLPVTPVISVRPQWAVATDLYVRVHSQPSLDSAIMGHLRSGDVVGIASISRLPVDAGGDRDSWYEIEASGLSGWALGSALDFYESRNRALNAAGLFGVDPDGLSSGSQAQNAK